MRSVTVVLSERERDFVLAAVRCWQLSPSDPLSIDVINEIATNAGAHDVLSVGEMDALAERINDLED